MTTLGLDALVKVNLLVSQGADNTYWFRYGAESDPVDITGYSARSQIRNRVGGDVWCEFLSTDGTIELGGAEGTIIVHLDHTVTEGWDDSQRKGVWDLELLDPSGSPVRFAEGSVTVSPDVTRAS